MHKVQHLNKHDVATLFGIDVSELSARAMHLIERHDFGYTALEGASREAAILQALKKNESRLSVSGPSGKGRWNEGWQENLQAFIASNYDLKTLMPKYYDSGNNSILRLHGNYIEPLDKNFEVNFLELMRVIVADLYLKGVTALHEFGCGPAHNLIAFSDIFPGMPMYGYDWAEPSQQIIELLREKKGIQITGGLFDLFEPNPHVKVESGAAVMTVGSLEQTGDRYRSFLEYVEVQRPRVCIHIEPIHEFYDEGTLMDYVAAQYSKRRGYLSGLYTTLKQKETEGRIKILKARKLLGSHFHDGWSLVVWSPM